MPASTLSRDILLAALAGFQLDKQRIDAKISEVQAMLDGGSSPAPGAPSSEPKKTTGNKRSAAVRRRMAEAQKARWARIKGDTEATPAAPEAGKAKRKLSAAGRAAIVKALKERWALKKAAAAPAKKASPKKAAAKKAAPAKATKKDARVKKAGARKLANPPAIAEAAGQ